jgi:hypothetical protein
LYVCVKQYEPPPPAVTVIVLPAHAVEGGFTNEAAGAGSIVTVVGGVSVAVQPAILRM